MGVSSEFSVYKNGLDTKCFIMTFLSYNSRVVDIFYQNSMLKSYAESVESEILTRVMDEAIGP